MIEEPFKIVLVGESNVGKKNIISAFIDGTFQEDMKSTGGGTFNTKYVVYDGGKVLKLEIWDTSWQERYRSLSKMLYKDAKAIILVYDITCKDSFEELQTYWFEEVKKIVMKILY